MSKQQPKQTDPDILSPGTPQISAAKFKAKHFPTLIIYQNEWMSWDGAAYQAIEADTINSRVHAFLGAAKVKGEEIATDDNGTKLKVAALFPFNPRLRDVSEVYGALKADCHVSKNTMDPPS